MEGLGGASLDAEGAGHLFSGKGPHRPCIGVAAGWEELAKSHSILFCSLGRPTVCMASSCPWWTWEEGDVTGCAEQWGQAWVWLMW